VLNLYSKIKRQLLERVKRKKDSSAEEVQRILDIVLESERYLNHSSHMWSCLAVATLDGLITKKEELFVKEEIAKYLGHTFGGEHYLTLRGALIGNGKPHEDKDCLAVYRDWKNRPYLSR